MESSKLMTLLFYDGSFNQDGRRMRAVYERTVSDGTDSYRLWRSAGQPDLDYASAENDKYYLYVEINGCLVLTGLTDHALVRRCGFAAVEKRYGGSDARGRHFDELREAGGGEAVRAALSEERAEIERLGNDPARQAEFIRATLDGHVRAYLKAKENGGRTFPDFTGALIMDDLAKCVELSAVYKAMRREEEKARAARRADEEKAYCEEENRKAEQIVSDAIQVIRSGGVLENGTVTFYRSRYKSSSYSVVLYLMRRYRVDVPLRTQGWINDKLASATIEDGRCTQVQYLRSRRGRCSEKVFACMGELIRAVAEEAPEDGKGIP